MSRSLSTATSPSSGIERDRLAALDLLAADRRVADRLGDDRASGSHAAGLGHRAGVGRGVEARVEREERGEALGGVARRDDDDRPVGHRGDLARGEDDVRVVGQERGPRARVDGARSPRAARRCSGWPTGRPGRRPRPRSRWKIAARPSPAATATTPRAGGRPRARRSRRRSRRVGRTVPPVGASPVNAAARVSRTSRAWLSRFSTLIRLSAPSAQPVADDQVRPLVVDVDLERPARRRRRARDSPIDSRWSRMASTSSGRRRSAWSRNIVS